jgi:hypothetical protein
MQAKFNIIVSETGNISEIAARTTGDSDYFTISDKYGNVVTIQACLAAAKGMVGSEYGAALAQELESKFEVLTNWKKEEQIEKPAVDEQSGDVPAAAAEDNK